MLQIQCPTTLNMKFQIEYESLNTSYVWLLQNDSFTHHCLADPRVPAPRIAPRIPMQQKNCHHSKFEIFPPPWKESSCPHAIPT